MRNLNVPDKSTEIFLSEKSCVQRFVDILSTLSKQSCYSPPKQLIELIKSISEFDTASHLYLNVMDK